MVTSSYFLLLTAVLVGVCSAEMFSSIAQMDAMISGEDGLRGKLELFIQGQENCLDSINRYIGKLEILTEDAKEHGILHPAMVYLHTVALSTELNEMVSLLNTVKEPEPELDDILKFRKQIVLPDLTDLTGAVIALERLQEVYQLEASQLVDGLLIDKTTPASQNLTLSAMDCYIIASQLFEAHRYGSSGYWYDIVIERCTNDSSVPNGCSDATIATALAQSSYIQYLSGNITAAILQAAEAITFDSECSEAIDYLKLYFIDESLEEENSTEAMAAAAQAEFIDLLQKNFWEDNPRSYDPQTERERFTSLCRGGSPDYPRDSKLDKGLRCRVTTAGSPYLLLQPVQVEELDTDPQIQIFRNFATQAEIKYLIPLGLETLHRSKVLRVSTVINETQEENEMDTVTYARTAKNTWINHDHSSTTSSFIQRVEAAISLQLDNGHGEPLQIANYGIGGHYDPHFDYFLYNHTKPLREGQEPPPTERIATFMVYLTDVPAGGATVFVRRNLTVYPRKGDVLFWYNLHRDGNGNADTLHAGCPVLVGSKWVMNLWIKADGQELTRPCLNEPDSPYA